jgi:hypothetical protein
MITIIVVKYMYCRGYDASAREITLAERETAHKNNNNADTISRKNEFSYFLKLIC